ncbi:MAG: DNA polymerase beta [Crocosphaera sp.]|nr:DNA polymerase beta [Crocosphaera sp.]
MTVLEKLQNKLEAYKPILLEKYNINQLGIFGLVSNSHDNQELNILIDYIEAPSLLDLVELEDWLTEKLKITVHIFTKNGLKGQRRKRILSEVSYI